MESKKLIVVAGLLVALIGACGGKGAPHRLGAYGPAPAPFLSLQDVNGAQPGYPGVAQITSVNGQLYYSGPDGGFAPVGSTGGGGSSGTAFGTPYLIHQNNDAGTSFQTWEFQNRFTNTAPGSETATNEFTTPLNGSQVTQDLSVLNGVAPQLVTTSVAQPSVAWNTRTDVLDITVGATTLTKLTVTGLDMGTDRCYAIEWITPSTGEAASITAQTLVRLNNETNGVGGTLVFQKGGGAATMSSTAAWVFSDSVDANSLDQSRAEFSAAPGGIVRGTIAMSVLQSAARFEERVTGVGDSATNVTSAVILPTSGNLAGTGDRYVFKRCRAFAH